MYAKIFLFSDPIFGSGEKYIHVLIFAIKYSE